MPFDQLLRRAFITLLGSAAPHGKPRSDGMPMTVLTKHEGHRMMVLRLYADSNGESHFDTQEIAMTLQEFAPPAAPVYVSESRAASHFVVIELPVAWGG